MEQRHPGSTGTATTIMSCTVTKTENILKVKYCSRVALADLNERHVGHADVEWGEWKGQEVVGQTEKAMVSCGVKSEFTSHDQTFLTSYITLLDACKQGDILLFCPRNFKG